MANPGDKFLYDHPMNSGYGEDALGQPLSAEMTELDMQDGMVVTFLEYDERAPDWALVEWVDAKGLDRITAIDPATFSNFIPQSGREL